MIEVTTKADRAKFYSSSEWKQLRQEVLERDHYECLWCREEGRTTTVDHSILEVDHIKELELHPDLATNMNNLRTLCKDHHNKRHHRFNYRSKQKEKKWNDEKW